MLKFNINKTFANQDECDKWEEINLPNRTYKGHTVLCVSHESNAGDPRIKLTTILCI